MNKLSNKQTLIEKEHTDILTTEEFISKLRADHRVLRMRSFIQHGKVTTYDHVISVAEKSIALNRHFHVHADEHRLVKGAFLHDYYLYDWHDDREERWHGFTHPQASLDNAERDFHLTDIERNMIRSHMWPLTLRHMPKCREAWLLCMADKIVSAKETLFQR